MNPPAPATAPVPPPEAVLKAELSRAEKAVLKHKQRNSLGAAKKPRYQQNNKLTAPATKIKQIPRAEKLYADAQKRRESLEQKRLSIDAECTFTPKITRSGKRSTSPLQDAENLSRGEMLYRDASKRMEKQKALVQSLTPTFKPMLSKVSTKTTKRGISKRKPLYQPHAQQHKEAEIERLRHKLEQEEKAKIDATRSGRNTYKSKNNAKQPSNVVERMALAAEKSKLRREILIQQQEAKERALLSFKPNISKKNHSSPRHSSSSNSDSKTQTFDRLYRGGAERKERLAHMKREQEQESQKTMTFRPKIRDKNGHLHLAKKKMDNSKWVNQQVLQGTLKLKHKKEAPTYKQVAEERELQQQREELTFQPSITSPVTSDDEGCGENLQQEEEQEQVIGKKEEEEAEEAEEGGAEDAEEGGAEEAGEAGEAEGEEEGKEQEEVKAGLDGAVDEVIVPVIEAVVEQETVKQ